MKGSCGAPAHCWMRSSGRSAGWARSWEPFSFSCRHRRHSTREWPRTFFSKLRERYAGPVVCEPRHVTWFEKSADAMLVRHRVARVATDPSRIKAALHPGGWIPSAAAAGEPAIVYYRLHGSPRKYWSRYPPERIRQWASEIDTLPAHRGCMVHLRQHRQRCGDRECARDDGAALAAQQTTAVPLTDTMSMPLFWPRTS